VSPVDDSGTMRPEFGDNGVIPRPMVAPLWRLC